MSRRDLSAVLRKRAEQSSALANLQTPEQAIDQAYDMLFGDVRAAPIPKRKQTVALEQLFPFRTANIGFRPYSEENLRALADDIAANGLLERIKVRPIQEGYEILSGHNRVNACRLLGWREIEADVEQVDDDRAIVIATVTNLQRRQGLLPSERGWAYRALLEAHRHQGKRNDLICAQNEHRSKTRDKVAAFFGVDRNKVQREIRLTYLIAPLLEAVDARKLNLMCGVALSYYDEQGQRLVWERLRTGEKLTGAVMQQVKQLSPPPALAPDILDAAWSDAAVPHQAKKLVFEGERFAPYLVRVKDEQELEDLFLEFLQNRFAEAIN